MVHVSARFNHYKRAGWFHACGAGQHFNQEDPCDIDSMKFQNTKVFWNSGFSTTRITWVARRHEQEKLNRTKHLARMPSLPSGSSLGYGIFPGSLEQGWHVSINLSPCNCQLDVEMD